MAKATIIFTGGTIAMKKSAHVLGVMPAASGQELLSLLPKASTRNDVEVRQFSNIPSGHMLPKMMMKLAREIETCLKDEETAGVVVTCGTDTMEEISYLVDLVVDSPKPVVFTGAMRNLSDPDSDGPRNLLASMMVAFDIKSRGMGTLVVMNDTIWAARDVTKLDTNNVDAFWSSQGPLGSVLQNKVIFFRAPINRQHLPVQDLETRVDLIKVVSGSDDRYLRCSADGGAQGVVIEALGCGNVPPAFFKGILYVLRKGVAVVMTSRCLKGSVSNTYGYEGGGGQLASAGVIFAEGLSGPKARIQLMVALGMPGGKEKLRDYFIN
ncbi:MAG: asparaginase [Bacillota bacterium]|jgi:L-asparaginase